MKKSIIYTIILLIGFMSGSIASVDISQTGMKPFDDWKPDKTGNHDITNLLQTAINWCISNNKTLYIAPGTYLVSDRIVANIFPGENCGNQNGEGSLSIYGDQIDRPVIRLQDYSPSFSISVSGTVPVLELNQAERDAANCLFWSTIRNLVFDLGRGNSHAAAIDFDAAQDCELANITVYASDIYEAGFTGIPGRNALVSNIQVIGGNYAFYLDRSSLGFCMSSISCFNQEKAGIFFNTGRGGSVTGLMIKNCKGPAIIAKGNGSEQSGHLVLTDAKIDISNHNTFAVEYNDRAILLKNVFVHGTDKLVKGVSKEFVKDTQEKWGHIIEYNYTPPTINKVNAYNVFEGYKSDERELCEFEITSVSPTNMADMHLPGELAAFNQNNVVSIEAYGAKANDQKDDYHAFKEAIQNHGKIFVPAGEYHLSEPISLEDSTILFGDPGKRTWLTPTYIAADRIWLLETPDSEGFCGIQDLAFNVPDEVFHGAIHWQTSEGYIYNVRNYLSSGHLEQNKHNYEFTAKAGCKVYGICEHNNFALWKVPKDEIPQASPVFRKVYIEGTSNPIIFYGLNLERGGSPRDEVLQYPFCEIKRAKNIRIHGAKTETDGPFISLSEVDNFFCSSIISTKRTNGNDIILIDTCCTNIEFAMINVPDTSGELISDNIGDYIQRNLIIGIYKLGKFSPEPFMQGHYDSLWIDAGPDNVLDPSENSTLLTATVSDPGMVRNYSWSRINTSGATIESPDQPGTIVSNLEDGWNYFMLEVEDTLGNKKSDVVKIVVNCTISSVKASSPESTISVFPNPASSYVNIRIAGKAICTMEMYHQSGRKVMNQTIKKGDDSINCSSIEPGLYILKITSDDQAYIGKLLVSHNIE